MSDQSNRDKIIAAFQFDQLPKVDAIPPYVHLMGYRPPWQQIENFNGVTIRKNITMRSLSASRDAHVVIGDNQNRITIRFGEGESSEHARGALVDILMGMMVTNLLKTQTLTNSLGDGGFMSHENPPRLVIFTRYNIVLHIQLDRGDAKHVLDLAYLLDKDLTTLTVHNTVEEYPIIDKIDIAAERVPLHSIVPFTFNYHDKANSELYAKIVTTAGPILRHEGKLRLIANHKGIHKIRIFLVASDGRTGVEEKTFEVV